MLTLMMQTNRRYSVTDLARLLDVDRRTVYRYITTFNRAGFVVLTNHHHVRLAQNTQLHKQLSDLLYFNQEEATTLYNAIDAIETDTLLKIELKNKLASIYGTRTIQEKIIRLQKSKVTKFIMEAIEKRHRVVLHNYSSPNSNSITDRLVEPFSLSDDSRHVWAYEISTGKNKLFKLSRIESVEILPQVCLYGIRHHKGTTDAFRIISMDGTTLPARIRMNRRARNLLIEEYPLTENSIHEEGNGEWIYEGKVSSYLGIGRFVIGLADCIVVETPELRDYIVQFAREHIMQEQNTTN